MANLRNFTATDNGVRWDLSIEYEFPSGTWNLFEAQLPRDLQDIDRHESEGAMIELTLAIARGQGISEVD